MMLTCPRFVTPSPHRACVRTKDEANNRTLPAGRRRWLSASATRKRFLLAGTFDAMKTIPLTNSDKVALVDDDDFERLIAYNWQLKSDGKSVYRCQWISGKPVTFYIHREVLHAPKKVQVDHKNHNILDNQKSNLRLVTNQQNQFNRIIESYPEKTSRFKGVDWRKDKQRWRARSQDIFLGHFLTEREAALKYNEHALNQFGEFALLNPL
jgi:hypothetical protein